MSGAIEASPVLWLAARVLLVCMFPFSALDKVLHCNDALEQANSSLLPGGPILLVLAMIVEVAAPIGIVAGWQVSFAAWLLAAFCVATVVLYHPFWPDALRADRVRSGQHGRRRAAVERRPLGRGEASLICSVQPVGWVGDWQENRAPQWIAPLSGRWFVESMNG